LPTATVSGAVKLTEADARLSHRADAGATLPTLSERDLERLVVDAARLGGWLSYHTFDSRRSPAGFPDLVLVRPPTLLIVELKTAKGRLRPEQADWLNALARCGIECAVIRPADADALVARLVNPPAKPGGSP
jgi:hypothetical protein